MDVEAFIGDRHSAAEDRLRPACQRQHFEIAREDDIRPRQPSQPAAQRDTGAGDGGKALGEAGVKSLEDFADLATDELTGWNERKNGETVKHKGYLSEHGVTAAEAEGLILQARVALGWIEAPAVEADAEAEAEQDA